MRSWDVALAVASDEGTPLYLRIAEAVVAEIERGRLGAGERLPSSRALADQLGVHRSTVVAAYEVLTSRGHVEARSTRGLFVAAGADGSPPTSEVGFDLPPGLPVVRPAPRDRDVRLLLGGVPDLRLLPHRELARAYARVLAGNAGRRALDYADPQGSERLRIALAEMLGRTRGIRVRPDGIAVVRGSQQGLYLVARALLRPGDRVAVESPGYPPTWQVLRQVGAEVLPIPVDAEGLDVAALAAEERVAAVVVTPHHQYPTTVTLSPSRRGALLALAARRRMAVIEDDYDFEFHFDGPPILPLAAADTAGHVVYVGTLSKVLAPGLRLGWVAGPGPAVERVVGYRRLVDQQGDHLVEQAVAALLEDGDVQRHVRKARRAYQARRDVLVEVLRAELPGIEVAPPTGGMALWARLPGVDSAAWAARGRAIGVYFQSGQSLRVDGAASDGVRLGFAACSEPELRDAVLRLVRALPAGAAG